jgi:hypothetical protein
MLLRFKFPRDQSRTLRMVRKGASGVWAETEQSAYVEQGTKIELLVRGRKLGESRLGTLAGVEEPILLREGDTLILTANTEPGLPARRAAPGGRLRPAQIGWTLPEVFRDARPGQRKLAISELPDRRGQPAPKAPRRTPPNRDT